MAHRTYKFDEDTDNQLQELVEYKKMETGRSSMTAVLTELIREAYKIFKPSSKS